MAKLATHQIPHYAWHEPDGDLGLTAIATIPLYGEQRALMRNYRVYPRTCNVMASMSASKAERGGSTPPGCANGEGTDASSVRV